MSGMIWGDDAWGAMPSLPIPDAPDTPNPSPDAFDPRMGGDLVWLAEIEAALDGGTQPTGGPAWADDAWAAMPPDFAPAGGSETVRVSDLGWRGRESDIGGALPYPPLLITGPDIDRRVALAPGSSDTFAWGSLGIASPGLVPGTSLTGRDTAMRRVRIRAGLRGWDQSRGYVTDPSTAGLIDVFAGMAMTWRATDQGAEVPLRDPTAWLDAPIGIRRFLGTGGTEGPSSLAGTPWPLVRGGTTGAPVRSCPVVLVNAASRVYRWTDGAGALVQVYEDGAPVYTFAGLVADVFAVGSPGAGAYYADALGQLKLGSDPAGTITVDGAVGSDPTAAAVLRDLLMVTLALPGGMLDLGSVITASSVAPYAGGWAWSGQETGRDAIKPLLAAMGARLVASRSGGLRLWALRALAADAAPVIRIDPWLLGVTIAPVALDAPLAPPAATWTVGYGHTHVTTTTPKPTVTPAERDRLAQPWRTAPWTDAANLSRYAQPSRPDLVETALLQQADAQSLANAIGALWGVQRSLWQVTMPTASVLLREFGDVVSLQWPADGLRAGALGQIVGDSIRAGTDTASILVLV
ncbi:MAG: hypothetical protein JWR10_3633 [Rubritepida sp.]|nr:hypothetical protein [Rubritepida sp.]